MKKYSRLSQHLDPAKLKIAVDEVGNLAKKYGVNIALIGGFALQLYGSDRLTGDIDFVADKWITGLPHGKPLSFGGFQTMSPNGVPVDIVLRSDFYSSLYDESISYSIRINGIRVPVVRAEYLAAMKMVAGRNRDLSDLEFLIISRNINLLKTKKIIRKFLGNYAVDEFERIVDESRWKFSKGLI